MMETKNVIAKEEINWKRLDSVRGFKSAKFSIILQIVTVLLLIISVKYFNGRYKENNKQISRVFTLLDTKCVEGRNHNTYYFIGQTNDNKRVSFNINESDYVKLVVGEKYRFKFSDQEYNSMLYDNGYGEKYREKAQPRVLSILLVALLVSCLISLLIDVINTDEDDYRYLNNIENRTSYSISTIDLFLVLMIVFSPFLIILLQ